jgi:hypothetical protein
VESLLKRCMIALSVCKPIARTHGLLILPGPKMESLRAFCLE